MPVSAASDPKQAIGRAPERLTLEEQRALAGKFIALEIYTPESLALRRIEAIGDSVDDCVRQLTERGHDPIRFEFLRREPPYQCLHACTVGAVHAGDSIASEVAEPRCL